MTCNLYILTGASRGMGLAMAQQLLQAGHSVLCISRQTKPELDLLAQKTGAGLTQWPQDLAQGVAASERLGTWLCSQTPSAWKSVTLINNAGALARIGPMRQADAADLGHALRVGLEAPMQLTAAFLAATENWGIPRKVLNISSGLGRRPLASQAAYCAAKAGMDHFTRCLALEEALKADGAKVCSLAPGVIDTDMQVQLRGAQASAFPDQAGFIQLKAGGQLASALDAAKRILVFLARPDFGANPIADVRD